MMEYRAWTAKQVEDWILEAAATELALPRLRGPKTFGSAMPTPVRDRQDAYGYHTTKVRRVPEPGAVDRYPKVLDWLNHHLEQPFDRQFLWFWALAKANPNRSVNKFASENQVNLRTLRRAIARHCQEIANGLNRKHEIRLTIQFDGLSEIPHEADPETVSSVKYGPDPKNQVYGQMLPGAKPRYPTDAEIAALTSQLTRQNKRRQREQRKRAA